MRLEGSILGPRLKHLRSRTWLYLSLVLLFFPLHLGTNHMHIVEVGLSREKNILLLKEAAYRSLNVQEMEMFRITGYFAGCLSEFASRSVLAKNETF